jgi:uracil phosphoribosyltransferase
MSMSLTHSGVTVLDHPLVRVELTVLRSVTTGTDGFRSSLNRLAELLFMEATRHFETVPVPVTTPLVTTMGAVLARPVVLVPILRAGLGLLDGVLDLLPGAVVAHLGIARNEETACPEPYYAKLPSCLPEAEVIVLDPMLATGGSACEALNQLKAVGATRLTLVTVLSCPQGVAAVTGAHPDVRLITGVVDEGLNERSYIVPGLGDAGDRYFGT